MLILSEMLLGSLSLSYTQSISTPKTMLNKI